MKTENCACDVVLVHLDAAAFYVLFPHLVSVCYCNAGFAAYKISVKWGVTILNPGMSQ